MERIFEFLFKYPPLFFEQGDFTFGAPTSVRLWLIIAGLLGAGTVASYTIARGKSTVTERSVMAGLRVMLLAVIIVCLLQPSLILSTVVPQQNFVGILIDDSQSMLLTDENGISRSSFVNDAFTSDESELVRQLSDRFALRFFRFSDVAGRIDSPAELTYEGTHTNLARALDARRCPRGTFGCATVRTGHDYRWG